MFEFRLHKNKVTHIEFSPREDWLLCMASTDSTVQLWDIRMLKDRKSAIAVLKHEKAVNSGNIIAIDHFYLSSEFKQLTILYYHLL